MVQRAEGLPTGHFLISACTCIAPNPKPQTPKSSLGGRETCRSRGMHDVDAKLGAPACASHGFDFRSVQVWCACRAAYKRLCQNRLLTWDLCGERWRSSRAAPLKASRPSKSRADGLVAHLEKDALRALPAHTPCAVPDPPRAQPQVSTSPEVQLNTPAAQEPLLDFLRDPSRLICIRPRGRDAGDSSPEPDEHYPSNRKRQGGPPLPGDMLALELLRAYSPALASFTCQVMHHSLVL